MSLMSNYPPDYYGDILDEMREEFEQKGTVILRKINEITVPEYAALSYKINKFKLCIEEATDFQGTVVTEQIFKQSFTQGYCGSEDEHIGRYTVIIYFAWTG